VSRLASLALFTSGDLALAGFEARVAVIPALLSFLGAAYALTRSADAIS
jgi:hypothetical protein